MEVDAAKSECKFCGAQMSDISKADEMKDPPMHHREIELADGRYMIFYTFGEELPAPDRPSEQGEDV
jgi:hypothetical protein